MPAGTRTSLESYKFIKDRFESVDFKERHEQVKQLNDLAGEIGIPLVQLALCWCLKNDNVSTVILGASKPEQLKQNIDSLNRLDLLDDGLMERIASIIKN